MDFVHLKVHTEFSINQGLNRITDLVKKAKANGMEMLAITDLNGMFGSIKFYEECVKKDENYENKIIKPIIGIDATIEQDNGNTYQLTLLAKNITGYKSLIAFNSKAYLENRKTDFAPAKEEYLGELRDVIVLSGGSQGLIGQKIIEGKKEEALEIAYQMKNFFGDDFYIELQRDGTQYEEIYMDGAIEICRKLKIPPVATHPVFFLEKEDFVAHETRYCIGHSEVLFSLKRKKPFNKEMYFKTKEEMEELFADIPQALNNTVAIAKKCNVELPFGVNHKLYLPNFPTPNGEDTNTYFTNLARKGLQERLEEDFPNKVEKESVRAKYEERLEKEINIIKEMGFPGYFLIVADFINWAKEHDIPVGPGRGSGAGSLVAYAMKITDIDPIPYNLLFERFLNPERVSMPDFDVDFCQARRNEVYDYVRQKYGEESVCQIGTFGTMAAKSAVRDVGRALGYNYDFVDTLAKMININPVRPITLKEFIFGEQDANGEWIINPDERLLARYNNEPDVKKLIDIAKNLEGITKQIGTHAAGVVIAPTKLTDFTPLYTLDPDSHPSTQFEMSDIEKVGLVKFDFLGLRNLTIIKSAIDLINERRAKKGEKPFNLRKINIKDEKVYEHIFCKGNTIGIFQFESPGMTAVLKRAQPKKLEDLVAINALYRPGPMDIIDEWLNAKNLPEKERQYLHPSLREILKETYGYMIYQEQVMQCAQIIAGYSLGEADLLRRAMGKKKPEEMREHRSKFVDGAKKNNIDETTANKIFDFMEKFAGYGFNKSHSVAYSYLAYQTAYLKTYFPEEFLTANLNSHITILDTDKIAILVNDARNNDIEVLPPDINQSNYNFTVEGDKKIRYGLGAIKGVGEKAVLAIEKEREANGPYTDFYNFLERAGRGNVNKRVIEAMVKAGVFDSLNANRAQLFEAISEGLDYVVKFRKKQLENTSVLGDSILDEKSVSKTKTRKSKKTIELVRPALPDIKAWDNLALIKNEKSVMGYFYSFNPYTSYYIKQLNGFDVATKLSEIDNKYNEGITEVYVGALIESIDWWKSKKGATVSITDGTTTISVMMFADLITKNKDWLKPDAFVSLKLKLKPDSQTNSIMITCSQAFNFEQTKKLLIDKVFVGSENNPIKIQRFDEICKPYIIEHSKSEAEVILCIPGSTGRRNQKIQSLNIKYEPALIDNLKKEFGNEWVKETFKKDLKDVQFPTLEYPKEYKNNNKNNKKRNSFCI